MGVETESWQVVAPTKDKNNIDNIYVAFFSKKIQFSQHFVRCSVRLI